MFSHALLAAALPGFIKFFAQGGFFMAVLVILSIFSLAVILQRALVIKMDRALPPDILRSVASSKRVPPSSLSRRASLSSPLPFHASS